MVRGHDWYISSVSPGPGYAHVPMPGFGVERLWVRHDALERALIAYFRDALESALDAERENNRLGVEKWKGLHA